MTNEPNQHQDKRSLLNIIWYIFAIALFVTLQINENKVKKQTAERNRQKRFQQVDYLNAVARHIKNTTDEALFNSFSIQQASKNIEPQRQLSLLHILCQLDRHQALEHYLAGGAFPDPRDHLGITPLMLSLTLNHDKCTELLFKYKASLTAVRKGDISVLHLAAETGHYEIAREALRAGADINATTGGLTPIHLACFKSQLRLVVLLCENGADTSGKTHHWTPGDLAFGKSSEIVSYLASRNAHFNKKFLMEKYEMSYGWPFAPEKELTKIEGEQPLMKAVEADSVPALTALHNQGVDINCRGYYGTPILIVAIANHKNEAAKYIAEVGQNFEVPDSNQKNALMYALANSNKETARILIKRGIKLDHADCSGNTALHYAVKSLNNDLAIELIAGGADIFATNYLNQGMFHIAAEHCNQAILPILIANGADVNQEDVRGNTALHLAAKANDLATTESLLRHGADFGILNLEHKTAQELTSRFEVLQLLKQRFEIEGINPAHQELNPEVTYGGSDADFQAEADEIRGL